MRCPSFFVPSCSVRLSVQVLGAVLIDGTSRVSSGGPVTNPVVGSGGPIAYRSDADADAPSDRCGAASTTPPALLAEDDDAVETASLGEEVMMPMLGRGCTHATERLLVLPYGGCLLPQNEEAGCRLVWSWSKSKASCRRDC